MLLGQTSQDKAHSLWCGKRCSFILLLFATHLLLHATSHLQAVPAARGLSTWQGAVWLPLPLCSFPFLPLCSFTCRALAWCSLPCACARPASSCPRAGPGAVLT